ncbi:DUF4231 domain-containing protein [filamentous cyanobacterium LEGE 11480]|uniref:DUF4231 domain-containing protein n=1 Tax=Romeriopsis navalis LEGE 11480 TaxID=2777977 RepID=A0A928VSL7_9CYAN|nr:DUF4231 domain-containing protein [Romeriopsis navalis]MBE9032993.1 DUF4231 domain-containing protein [Romeriopsis navalis LEGE 11480]
MRTRNLTDSLIHLTQELNRTIDHLPIPASQKSEFKRQWIERLATIESEAMRMKQLHQSVALLDITFGGCIPILVIIDTDLITFSPLSMMIIMLLLSGLVILGIALEQWSTFKQSWHLHRRSAERIKTHSWQFITLSGEYSTCQTHSEAYPTFESLLHKIQLQAQQYD